MLFNIHYVDVNDGFLIIQLPFFNPIIYLKFLPI